MASKLLTLTLLGAALMTATPAFAHCDSVDGPVAGAALSALDAGNVIIALPYAPASAEPEIKRAFKSATDARAQGGPSKALADRWFMETVVRLHRAGEGAPYTGLKPGGDHGPVIPAAERALATGEATGVIQALTAELRDGLDARLTRARELQAAAPAEARTAVEVAAVRQRVRAEFDFVTYSEGVRSALVGAGVQTEGGATHADGAEGR